MLTIIIDAVDLAQKIAGITVSVSKRLSKTLDLLFGGSLKSKAKLQKAKAKKKKPKAIARKVPLSVRYRSNGIRLAITFALLVVVESKV